MLDSTQSQNQIQTSGIEDKQELKTQSHSLVEAVKSERSSSDEKESSLDNVSVNNSTNN